MEQQLIHGTIDYPFAEPTAPLGRDVATPAEKFVIRSAVGAAEYVVEIPGGARDYDVHVPLAEIAPAEDLAAAGGGASPRNLANPTVTDSELVKDFPSLEKARPTDTAMLDGAFGVGEAEGPRQAPSYSLGISKINEYYKRRQYEYALIEINNLLAFYPNSPKLHKMKGTVLVKMRNLKLAELAWIKALQLTPQDKTLQAALERLQRRIIAIGEASQGMSLDKPYQIPEPVGTGPATVEEALAH